MTRTPNLSTLRRLLSASLLAFSALAHAGHWAIVYSGGTGTDPGGTPHPYTLSNGGYGGGGIGASGTITATFTWTPDGSTDVSEPPSTVYVLESCGAGGTSDSSGRPPQAAADNGLKSGTVSTTYQVAPGYTQYTKSSNGTRITYENLGGARSFQVTASPSAAGSITSGVNYSASVSPYALAIHGDCDESFHKGANGPESNSTNVLTPAFGDIFVDPSASGAQDPFTGTYRFWFGFTGEAIGFGSGFSPTWNLWGTTSSAWNHETHWVDFMPTDLAALSDSPIQRVVTLSASDSNGASANATYTLRIHHPHEKWHQIGDLPDVSEDIGDLKTDSPGYASAHGSIHSTYNNPGPEWKLLSVAVTVGTADVGGPLWKYFFKAVGIGISDLGPKPDNGDASFDSCWGTAKSTISGGSWNDDKALYQMSPRLVLTYHAHKLEADGYGPHGYIGPVREGVTDKQEFAREWAGDFTRVSGSSGGGGS